MSKKETAETSEKNALSTEVKSKATETIKHLKPRNLGEVVVEITPQGFDTMEFLFAKQLSRDARKNRQQWLGMTEPEEKDREHEVLVLTLSKLLLAEPLNVPDWTTTDDPAGLFISYFSGEEYETFIEQLNTLYLGKLLPIEYYKKVSE